MSLYIKPGAIKKLAHEKGKRVSATFIQQLDLHVDRVVRVALSVHDGGRKTLDRDVAIYCGAR